MKTELIAIAFAMALAACVDRYPVLRPIVTSEGQERFALCATMTTSPANASADYERVMAAVAKVRASDGNVAVYVMRRDHEDRVEFVVISIWTSRDRAEKCRQSRACASDAGAFELVFESTR